MITSTSILVFSLIIGNYVLLSSCDSSTTAILPFFIKKSETKSHTVKLSSECECTFSYDSNESDSPQESTNWPEPKTLIEGITEKLQGKCAMGNKEGWGYEVCLGSQVRQFIGGLNGQSYNLGSFKGFAEENTEIEHLYEDGSSEGCQQKNRKAIVKFVCGGKYEIGSISEPDLCTYKIIVSIPELCGHPKFGTIQTSSEQPWALELIKFHDSSVQCKAHHTGYGNNTPMNFAKASLSFSGNTKIFKSAARGPNRVALTADPTDGGVQIESKQLNYMEIITERTN